MYVYILYLYNFRPKIFAANLMLNREITYKITSAVWHWLNGREEPAGVETIPGGR